MNTSQLEYTSTENNSSGQNTAILEELLKNKNQWVPMPHLGRISGSMAVATRISNLRAQGHIITQQSRRHPGSRQTHSFYRLEVV